MGIDFLAQMTVAYFVVFGLILAVRRFGMPLQAAAGLVTLQGALYVFTLFAGGALVLRWKEDLRYLLAFVLLFAQALLCGLGTGPWALWTGAALSGIGLGCRASPAPRASAHSCRATGAAASAASLRSGRRPAVSSARWSAAWSASGSAPRPAF